MKITTTLVAVAALTLLAGHAEAQQAVSGDTTHHVARRATHHRTSTAAALRAEAKVSEDSARTIALAQVPSGTVKSSELEREHGKLIWSFDISVPGKSGIEEVNVDAISGAMVAHEHEGPKAERKEAAQEAKEHATARAKRSATRDSTRKP